MEFRNFFLASLHADDAASLVPHLREVSLANGQGLFEPEEIVDLIYFPGSSCVSIVTVMTDGRAIETSTIGRESAVGLLDAITGERARSRIFAQIGGGAMTLNATIYRDRLKQSDLLLQLTLRHARANAYQAEIGVACNLAHPAPNRLARWLLMTQDRTGSPTFPLTQEYLAVMTGVQRTTVSQIASDLKRTRVIDYSRGYMTIVDRPALIRHACECYSSVEDQFIALEASAG